MRRLRLAAATAVLAAAITPAVASAGPPISFVLTLECDDGSTFDINFGPPKNQGTALHLVGENGVLTSNYFKLVITDEFGDDFVLIDSTRGLDGLDGRELLTCTGSSGDEFTTFTWTVIGFVTPRAP